MANDKFKDSLESGIHKKFMQMEGNWEGAAKVWFEPGDPVDESIMTGSMKPILGGRFMLHEYAATFKGKPISGIAIIGYSFSDEKFQVAWVDSFHTGTGILFSAGNDSGKLFSATGSYGGVDIPEPWGWRTEIEMPSADRLVITAYNITPQGESQKATETMYKRK